MQQPSTVAVQGGDVDSRGLLELEHALLEVDDPSLEPVQPFRWRRFRARCVTLGGAPSAGERRLHRRLRPLRRFLIRGWPRLTSHFGKRGAASDLPMNPDVSTMIE